MTDYNLISFDHDSNLGTARIQQMSVPDGGYQPPVEPPGNWPGPPYTMTHSGDLAAGQVIEVEDGEHLGILSAGTIYGTILAHPGSAITVDGPYRITFHRGGSLVANGSAAKVISIRGQHPFNSELRSHPGNINLSYCRVREIKLTGAIPQR